MAWKKSGSNLVRQELQDDQYDIKRFVVTAANEQLSKASDHKNEDGKYNVHVYYVDQADKTKIHHRETTTEVHHVKPSGTTTIENNNSEQGFWCKVIRSNVAQMAWKKFWYQPGQKNWQDD